LTEQYVTEWVTQKPFSYVLLLEMLMNVGIF
jgi:hypothetical protein